jgi:hypothetical protein
MRLGTDEVNMISKHRMTSNWKDEVEAAWPDDLDYLEYTSSDDGKILYADVDSTSAGELNTATGVSVVYGPDDYM